MGTSSSKTNTFTSNPLNASKKSARRAAEEEQEEELSSIPLLSNWAVQVSSLLCLATYEQDAMAFLRKHGMHEYVTATRVAEDRGVLVAEAVDAAQQKNFLFVAFGDSHRAQDVEQTLRRLPTFAAVRAEDAHAHANTHTHAQGDFLDRGAAIRPDFFLDKFKRGTTVVVCGHSLGGASAALLTERLLNSFLHLRVYNRLACVTFGAPVIAGRYTARNIRLNQEIYNHFVVDEDPLPRVLCIDRNNRLFARDGGHPTGKLFRLSQQHADCKLLSEAQCTEFYEETMQIGENVEKALAAHAMSQYDALLRHTGVVPPSAENTASADAAAAAEKEIATIQVQPSVSLCTLIGLELEIRGTQLSLIESATVAGVKVQSITYHTETCMICRVSELVSAQLDTSRTVTVGLRDCFGEEHTQRDVDLRLVGTAKANVFPSALLASVLPLTSLVVNGGTLTSDMLDTLEDIRRHVKGVESSIPIEFAFNMMTKNGRDFEDAASHFATSQEDNLIYLYMFLQRLAEVDIANWPQLCSTHMLRVLQDSISNLETLMIHERDGQIRKLLDQAFKPALSSLQTSTHQLFDDAYSTLCKEDFDNIFCTNQAHSALDFWTFIAGAQVDSGFAFVQGMRTPGQHLHFREPQFANEANTLVVRLESTEKLPLDSSARDLSVVLRKFSVKTTDDQGLAATTRIFNHFELNLDADSNKWVANKAVVRAIAETLVKAKQIESEVKKEASHAPVGSPATSRPAIASTTSVYHVQSFDGQFFLASWFVLNWFLSYVDGTALEQTDIERTAAGLQEDIPLNNQGVAGYDASLRVFHEAVIAALQKHKQSFFIRNHPRKKVLARLKRVRAEMLSNYYSVVPPFFCGLGVDFPVRETAAAGKSRPKVPFFNFIPKPLVVETSADSVVRVREDNDNEDESNDANNHNNTPLTLSDVVERAEQASAGLQFMLLMMDKYEILTKQELFQTQNDAATTAMRAAAVPLQAIPKAISGAYKVMRYLATGDFSNIIEVNSSFRHLFNSVYFSEQKVESYSDFLDQLIHNLQLSVDTSSFTFSRETQISDKLDCIFKSIPPIVGELSVKDLINNSEQIFAHTPWYSLLDSRSKMLHIFMMKQIFHCYHIRSLRSKFVTVGINGEKNAGKTTLSSLLLGSDVVKGRRGLNMDDSTIFPTAYVDPVDLPHSETSAENSQRHLGTNTMIIDLPGCTDSLAYTIPSLFFPAVDISIFIISSRQSKKCDSSLSQFINAFVRVRKGPTLLCINGYDKHLEDCVDFDGPYIEHAKTFIPKPNAQELCANILLKEKTAWQQSATLQLPPMRENQPFVWKCERDNEKIKNCVVHSSLPNNDYPISVWMTSFLVDQVRYSFANDMILNSTHVRQWINEAREWYNTATYRLNIVDTELPPGRRMSQMSICM